MREPFFRFALQAGAVFFFFLFFRFVQSNPICATFSFVVTFSLFLRLFIQLEKVEGKTLFSVHFFSIKTKLKRIA